MNQNAKNSLSGKANFHIHNFILDIGLNTSETLVYAFLYSFSQGSPGIFYGSQAYIAKTLGISQRTVERVFKSLRERGLIEKCTSTDGSVRGVRAILPTKKKMSEEEKERCELISEQIEKEPKTSQEIEDSLPYIEEKFAPIEIPNIETLNISREQYMKLRELVPPDVLYGYARRFDKYMYKRLEGMLPSPRSHYKILKKWIEEDYST